MYPVGYGEATSSNRAIVPAVRNLVGLQAAFLLSVTQDLALAVAGVAGLVWIVRAGRPAGVKA